ncbi:hypothetical protein, partial [Staphylococcus nepalensis]|uniref:hypothetical protein n=1 Tax=Staphylococcus nepalensis TaxID=214473 RepID=UPI00285D0668
ILSRVRWTKVSEVGSCNKGADILSFLVIENDNLHENIESIVQVSSSRITQVSEQIRRMSETPETV